MGGQQRGHAGAPQEGTREPSQAGDAGEADLLLPEARRRGPALSLATRHRCGWAECTLVEHDLSLSRGH